MKKIVGKRFARNVLIILGILLVLFVLVVWYGVTHLTPEAKVKIGLIKLRIKLWEIGSKSPKCASEMTCLW